MLKRKLQITETLLQNIKDAFDYQADVGILRWKNAPSTNIAAGFIAGRKHGNGHIEVKFKDTPYMAHHIAWFLHHGTWPTTRIVHINRDKSDNRIANLEALPCSPSA